MLRFLKTILIAFIVGVMLGASIMTLVRSRQGDRLLSVQSGSMQPAFAPGDALLTHKVNLAELKVGDIISYRSPSDKKVLVSHRLIEVNYLTGRLVTKGDNVDLKDIPLPVSAVVGKVYKIVPNLGYALDFLHKPIGLIAVVYTPALFILLVEAKRLGRQFSKPYFYRLYGYNSSTQH